MLSRRRQALLEADDDSEKNKKDNEKSGKSKQNTLTERSAAKQGPHKKFINVKNSKLQPRPQFEKKKESKKKAPRIHITSDPSFLYPPEDFELEITKNENIAANTSKVSAKFLLDQWIEGKNSVLIDETKSIKYAVVSIFIEKLKISYKTCPPFILLIKSADIPIWIEQIKFWTTQTFHVATTIKSERVLIRDSNVLYDPTVARDYGLIICSYEQANRDPSVIPNRRWASIIADDPPDTLDTSNMTSLQKTYVSWENKDENKALDTFLEVPEAAVVDPSTIFVISPEDAAKDNLFEENYTPCPLISIQHTLYLKTMLEYSQRMENQESRNTELMCELGRKLRYISSHPMLLLNEPIDVLNSSGKTVVLQKILAQQKIDGKKAAIFCSNDLVSIIDSVLTEAKVAHCMINEEETEEDAMKIVDVFNNSAEIESILCPVKFSSFILKNFNGETVIAFDTDWVPVEDAALVVAWHARLPRAQIYRLITSDSYECVLFKHFWRNRDSKPIYFDSPDGVDNEVILSLIKEAYFLALKNLDIPHAVTRSIFREIKAIPYLDQTLFPELNEEWNDSFWNLTQKHRIISQENHIKPLTASQFWTYPRLNSFLEIFKNVGWGKWNCFGQFERSEHELQKLAVVILKYAIKRLASGEDVVPRLSIIVKESEHTDLKRFMKSIAAWKQFSENLADNSFLITLENYLVMDGIILENDTFFEQFGELMTEKTPQSVREMMQAVREGRIEELNEADREFVDNLVQSAKKLASPILTSQKAIKASKFDGDAHDKVVNTLLTYGFTDVKKFMLMADLESYDPNVVQSYVECVIKASEDGQTAQRSKAVLLKKIPKYQILKLPQRLQMFEKIRESVAKYDEYPAEEIEFLKAVDSHGIIISQSSPIMKCVFKGTPSEPKVLGKIKTIFEEPIRSKVVQRIPKDSLQKLPLKINDMMMLMSLGEIDPRFHNEDFVYPIGYSINVVLPSITNPTMLAWAECRIVLEGDELAFIINPTPTTEVGTYRGKSPDDVLEKYRVDLKKAAGMHITYYDGHEIFGLTSSFVHRILLETPRIEECTKYRRRFFSTIFPLIGKWPQIGRYEGEEESGIIQGAVQKHNPKKFKFKKKMFGELLPPLVVDCNALSLDNSKRYAIDITSETAPSAVVDAFDSWTDFSSFLSPP